MIDHLKALELTDAAWSQIASLLEGRAACGLRLYVEAGGCGVPHYGMVMDSPKTEDLVLMQGSCKVLLDPSSLDQLRGSTVDYEDGLTGAGFKIRNPSAEAHCGCGSSLQK